MKEKIIKTARFIISVIYVPAFMLILMLAARSMCVNGPEGSAHFAPIVSCALLLAACAAFFMLLKRAEGKYKIFSSDKTVNCVFIACWLFVFALQIYITARLGYVGIADSLWIDQSSRTAVNDGSFAMVEQKLTGHTEYYSRYPNNWAILMFTTLVYKIVYEILGYIPQAMPPVLGIICIQTSTIILFLIAKLIFTEKRTLIFTSVFIAALPVFLLYSQIYYTDTLSMPFVVAAVYCFIRACRAEKRQNALLWISATAVLIGLGYKIKGSLGVLLIAMVMYAFMKIGAKRASAIAILSVVMIFVFNAFFDNLGLAVNLTTEEKLYRERIPFIHWVMMSSVGRGAVNQELYHYTISHEGYENKKEAAKVKLKEIMSDYTPKEFLEHLCQKCTFTWNDGKYFAAHHYQACEDNEVHGFLSEDKYYTTYCNGIHLTMLMLMLMSMIGGVFEKEVKPMLLMRTAVFGIAVFLLIWETRSRYLVNFTPLFVLISVDGLSYLCTWMSNAYNVLMRRTKKKELIKT